MTKSALIVHPDYNLYQKNNTAFCSSLQVAKEFGKNHQHVLRDIRELNCSVEFHEQNFQLMEQNIVMPNGGTRKEAMYYMTRDGFIHLAMSYRGKKAAITREEIIKNGFHSNIN